MTKQMDLMNQEEVYNSVMSNCRRCTNFEVCQSTGCTIKKLFIELIDDYYGKDNK